MVDKWLVGQTERQTDRQTDICAMLNSSWHLRYMTVAITIDSAPRSTGIPSDCHFIALITTTPALYCAFAQAVLEGALLEARAGRIPVARKFLQYLIQHVPW